MGPNVREEQMTDSGELSMDRLDQNENKEWAKDKPKERLPQWVIIWFYVTAVICTWDASFIMLRPWSLPGGSLSWIWHFYKYYITLDQRYQDTKDAYVFAQSLMNYVEVIFNIITIAMHYSNSRHTVMTAFMVSVMTFWKTVLYFLMLSEFCTGGEYRQGNSALAEFFLVFIPNFIWVVVPLGVMYVLWFQLIQEVAAAAKSVSSQMKMEEKYAVQGFGENIESPLRYGLKLGQVCSGPKENNAFTKSQCLLTPSADDTDLHQRKSQR